MNTFVVINYISDDIFYFDLFQVNLELIQNSLSCHEIKQLTLILLPLLKAVPRSFSTLTNRNLTFVILSTGRESFLPSWWTVRNRPDRLSQASQDCWRETGRLNRTLSGRRPRRLWWRRTPHWPGRRKVLRYPVEPENRGEHFSMDDTSSASTAKLEIK